MHKTGADLLFLCDMGNWSLTRLLCYLVTKSFCCPLIPATGAISFRERSLTPPTTKPSLINDQIDLISSKPDISFHWAIAYRGSCYSLLHIWGRIHALFWLSISNSGRSRGTMIP